MRRELLASLLLAAACSRSGGVAPGATVSLDYELSSDGAIIESSNGREPLVVTQGQGGLPAEVDEALLGMAAGEEKIVELSVLQGFGPVDPTKIRAIPLAKFGAMAKDLAIGKIVAGAEGGKAAEGRVVKVENGSATLDFNHPLAGKALRYRVKVVGIK